MPHISANPVKGLHVCDFEFLYWAEIKRVKQGPRRALYAASVRFWCYYF